MDNKFKRFLEMTDYPERFTDEELMQLARDPEMDAWYQTLAAVEASADIHTSTDVKPRAARRFRLSRVAASLLAAAAAVLVAVLVLKPKDSTERTKVERPVAKTERAETAIVIKNARRTTGHVQSEKRNKTDNVLKTLPTEQPPPAVQNVELRATTPPAHTSTLELLATTPPAKSTTLELLASTPQAKGNTATLAIEQTSIPSTKVLSTKVEPPAVTANTQISEPPTLSAEKQALANMYLAEVALQVAYKRQAQLQAVRAYTTSIIGQEEPAQPTIAF